MAASKPTVVIVPDCFCTPPLYEPVAEPLRQLGYEVRIVKLWTGGLPEGVVPEDSLSIEGSSWVSWGKIPEEYFTPVEKAALKGGCGEGDGGDGKGKGRMHEQPPSTWEYGSAEESTKETERNDNLRSRLLKKRAKDGIAKMLAYMERANNAGHYSFKERSSKSSSSKHNSSRTSLPKDNSSRHSTSKNRSYSSKGSSSKISSSMDNRSRGSASSFSSLQSCMKKSVWSEDGTITARDFVLAKGTPERLPRKEWTLGDDCFALRQVLLPLIHEKKEILLVGHGYGGAVITQGSKGLGKSDRAAEGKKGGITTLLYVAGIVPEYGETVFEAVRGMSPLRPDGYAVSLSLPFL
jgi:hypothetical protein